MLRSVLTIALALVLVVSASAQVVINEICATNGDINYDQQFFNFPGWIELYNAGSTEVNLSNYSLTDEPTFKNKWQIPANTKIASKSHLLIWCDNMATGLHSNFTLDADGETLILSNSVQTTVDQITFPKQSINVSYGRITNGSATWSYLNTPTPLTANNGQVISNQLDKPMVLLPAGRYNNTQQAILSHSVLGVTIRYTLDGSEPVATSAPYVNPITISNTLTLKAKAFHPDFISSNTTTATYFINEHAFTLPVVSISTKPAFLFDNTIGIYADGTNGIPGHCQNNPMNWNQDWDRHAVFEYFQPNGTKDLEQHVEIRIGGNCSRNNPQKSFVIKARDMFGSNTIQYEMFSSKNIDSFGGFMLRNSGNDFWSTMFRDALLHYLPLGQMDVDYMAYQPTAVYLNGAYWGLMNMREKIDADYIESNYGINKNDLDLLETGGSPLEGDNIAYTSFLNNLQQMDLNDPQTFQYIDEHIDVQEFINYLSAEIYYANTDWPGNNMKFWRQRSTNGKFRWILWDLDFGFGVYSEFSWPTHPTFNFATEQFGNAWPNPAWSTLLIRLLLQTPEFRTRFIQTFTTSMGTTFKPERVNTMIDQFQTRIAAEMIYHLPRWGNNLDNWNASVQQMRNFSTTRNSFMWGHTAAFFGLNGTLGEITVAGTPAVATGFDINGIYSDAPVTQTPYFNGLTYSIAAKPKTGYKFKEWKITKQEATPISLIEQGTTWRYFDQGFKPAADWMNPGYSDATWDEGNAQLGYGGDGEVTTVDYGGNAADKFITTYFRKSFNVNATANLEDIQARVLFDDGLVVYVNGQEVYRNNLPEGTIDYATLAPAFIDPERTFYSFTISKDLLQVGTNVIAVEVHQTNAQSSDLAFDLAMSTVELGNTSVSTSANITQQDIAFGNITLEASFESAEPITGLVINEINASNSSLADPFGEQDDWIEIYNTGTKAVDLSGLYITDKLNNKLKHQLQSGVNNEMILDPGEYIILWADEQPTQGVTHLSFKLSAEGEAVGIYQRIGESIVTLDEVTFGTAKLNTSFSRIPNASGPIEITSTITPNEENVFTVVGSEEPEAGFPATLYPNPSTGVVRIRTESLLTRIVIYDSKGQVCNILESLPENEEILLPEVPGLYLIRLQSKQGGRVLKVIRQ